jgi:hypothetical protein
VGRHIICGPHFIEGHVTAVSYVHFPEHELELHLEIFLFTQEDEYGYVTECLHILAERLQST